MSGPSTTPKPAIVPLGDSCILVRFDTSLTEAANRAAIALAASLEEDPISGVVEVVPNLVSVLLRYEPPAQSFAPIAGELRLRLAAPVTTMPARKNWTIPILFDGPDLAEVAASLNLSPHDFLYLHNARPLRVLGTGFAPGFVYCGLHPEQLVLPRRTTVRPLVPAGSVLFAAGQTAIAATDMPTGWHVIGRTDFVNFDTQADPPTRLAAGDTVTFEVAE